MKCLVTGATGFIGRALCAQLLARGDSLVALSRSGAALPDGTATQAIDLTQSGIPAELLRGVNVVFHLAGIAHQRARLSNYALVNHHATLQLARDALAAGVNCFVFFSSVKAMGTADTGRERNEFDCHTPVDPYGLSKWRAECELRAEFEQSAMKVRIIRPSLVYGTEPKGNLALLARGIRYGLPRPPEGGARSMIALQDLVRFSFSAAESDKTGVCTWIATDGEHYSTRSVYELLRKRAGKSVGTAWWPRWCWRLAAAGYDLLRPSPESTWEKLFATQLYSNEAARADLGWAPQLTMSDVIAAPQPVVGR